VRKFIIIFFVPLLVSHCSKRSLDNDSNDDPNRLVNRYGTDATFDIATWNIEQFPLEGRTTVSYVAQLIKDMDLDMYGLQEINDINYFHALLDSLPGYTGFVSSLPSQILKLAIIYKKDMISITTPFQIYTDDWYAFPRPPLVTYVEVRQQNQVVFDFTLIINHLKAFGDDTSIDRRQDACEKLENYIDTEILTSEDTDCLLIGDLNDQLDEPPVRNVFTVFLNDTINYRFLTIPLIGQASYIGSQNSLIDHLMITHDAEEEYYGGDTQILYLEKEFDRYTTHVSDHRPVISQFPVF